MAETGSAPGRIEGTTNTQIIYIYVIIIYIWVFALRLRGLQSARLKQNLHIEVYKLLFLPQTLHALYPASTTTVRTPSVTKLLED